MFTNHQNPIALVRRELRGHFPDDWLNEVVSVLEWHESMDDLSMEELLKLRVAMPYSATLKQLLDRASRQLQSSQSQAITVQPRSNGLFDGLFGKNW